MVMLVLGRYRTYPVLLLLLWTLLFSVFLGIPPGSIVVTHCSRTPYMSGFGVYWRRVPIKQCVAVSVTHALEVYWTLKNIMGRFACQAGCSRAGAVLPSPGQ